MNKYNVIVFDFVFPLYTLVKCVQGCASTIIQNTSRNHFAIEFRHKVYKSKFQRIKNL